MRVISLVPSATETLLAWGIEPVACTRFCEQPALRHVGGTKDPDIDAIAVLQPDLVVMCDQENRLEDADALTARGIQQHVIHLLDVDDNGPEMDRLATALDRADRIGTCGVGHHDDPPISLRAFVPIWKRPWMSINAETYGSTLLRRLGIANVAADCPDRYPSFADVEAIRSLRPDVVLAPTEPYPFAERHRVQLEEIAPTVFVDGQDLFWWGARTPAAIERLRSALR
jgi:ABC-type Fe3+-hydroxamate transport system substrate-binding protein